MPICCVNIFLSQLFVGTYIAWADWVMVGDVGGAWICGLTDVFAWFNVGWLDSGVMVCVGLIHVFDHVLPAIYLTPENPMISICYGTAVKIPTFLRHGFDTL